MPASKTRIFVYGTLLAGESNHALLRAAIPIGPGRTRPELSLHDLGPYPALALGGVHAIEGEVYEVDADTLRDLDLLEDHPRWYRRTPITLEDGREVETYVMGPESVGAAKLIPSGSWKKR